MKKHDRLASTLEAQGWIKTDQPSTWRAPNQLETATITPFYEGFSLALIFTDEPRTQLHVSDIEPHEIEETVAAFRRIARRRCTE